MRLQLATRAWKTFSLQWGFRAVCANLRERFPFSSVWLYAHYNRMCFAQYFLYIRQQCLPLLKLSNEACYWRLYLQILGIQGTRSTKGMCWVYKEFPSNEALMAGGLSSHPKHRNRFSLEVQDKSEISTITTSWPFLSSNLHRGQKERDILLSPHFNLL